MFVCVFVRVFVRVFVCVAYFVVGCLLGYFCVGCLYGVFNGFFGVGSQGICCLRVCVDFCCRWLFVCVCMCSG